MLFGFLKRIKSKTKYPSVNRRREERYEAEDEFVVRFTNSTKASFHGQSRDISVHGVRFVTSYKLSSRKIVDLNFVFPNGFPGAKEIRIPAKIVRVYRPRGTERYRVACSLNHQSEITKEVLRQFIYWLSHRS